MCRARKGGRAVECTGLENQQAGNPRFGGSNPPPSVFAPNPQPSFPGDWRELWREQSIFRIAEPKSPGLENQQAGNPRFGGSNPPPSVQVVAGSGPLNRVGTGASLARAAGFG
jgi:hypothetical protein